MIKRKTKFVLALAAASIMGGTFYVGPLNAANPPANPPANTPAIPSTPDMRSQFGSPIESNRLVFRYWSKVKGENLYSVQNDKNLGDITDALFQRGDGRIEYLIVKTDTTLGMGGKLVLVPYDQLVIREGDKREFRLDATQDQVKTMTEFTAQGWQEIGKPNPGAGSKTLREALSKQGARQRVDPYAGKIDASKPATVVEGKITDVDRRTVNGVGQQVIIKVQDDAGKSHEIALGPSWFATAGDTAPSRGDHVRVATLRTNTGDALLVATSISIRGNEARYREETGTASWLGEPADGISPSQYVLATEIMGKEVSAQGAKCGKIDDLVVERASGRLAYLSIDPDQNFLGMGDTKRLVPFSVATPQHDNRVAIDASKEMILASSPTPKSLDELRSEDFRRKASGGFQVNTENFMTR